MRGYVAVRGMWLTSVFTYHDLPLALTRADHEHQKRDSRGSAGVLNRRR